MVSRDEKGCNVGWRSNLFIAQKAVEMAPLAIGYFFAGHVSAEAGAEEALEKLGLTAPRVCIFLMVPAKVLLCALPCLMQVSKRIKKWKHLKKQAYM